MCPLDQNEKHFNIKSNMIEKRRYKQLNLIISKWDIIINKPEMDKYVLVDELNGYARYLALVAKVSI